MRLTTKRGKASKRKLGVRIKMYWLSEEDRWVAVPGGDVRIKRIPDEETFWRVVEGMKVAVVGVGMGMKKRKGKE